MIRKEKKFEQTEQELKDLYVELEEDGYVRFLSKARRLNIKKRVWMLKKRLKGEDPRWNVVGAKKGRLSPTEKKEVEVERLRLFNVGLEKAMESGREEDIVGFLAKAERQKESERKKLARSRRKLSKRQRELLEKIREFHEMGYDKYFLTGRDVQSAKGLERAGKIKITVTNYNSCIAELLS